MRQQTLSAYIDTEAENGHACPTCGEVFDRLNSMKTHHTLKHGESIAGATVQCIVCGEEKTIQPSRAREQDLFFCMKEGGCHSKWKSENWVGEDNPRWNGGGYEVNCSYCGDPKTVDAYDLDQNEHHFCNRTCAAKWRSENWVGPRHPLWKGGEGLYRTLTHTMATEGWSSISERQKRETPECENCGVSRSEANLDVHHIVPLLCGGTHADELLMVLCRQCHGKAESFTYSYPEFRNLFVE